MADYCIKCAIEEGFPVSEAWYPCEGCGSYGEVAWEKNLTLGLAATVAFDVATPILSHALLADLW